MSLFGSIILSILFLLSCGNNSTQEKLVGVWETPDQDGTVVFYSDGTFKSDYDEGAWKLKKLVKINIS